MWFPNFNNMCLLFVQCGYKFPNGRPEGCKHKEVRKIGDDGEEFRRCLFEGGCLNGFGASGYRGKDDQRHRRKPGSNLHPKPKNLKKNKHKKKTRNFRHRFVLESPEMRFVLV